MLLRLRMATHEGIHGYLSKLNSLSEKITRDVNKVKAAYSQDAWLTLTLNEQENILNNQLINPDIYTKYYNGIEEKKRRIKAENFKNDYQQLGCSDAVYLYNEKDLYTYTYQNVGLKILHDENTRDCRDEHSFPFSYRTKSQINIPSKEFEDVSVLGAPNDVTKSHYLSLRTNDSHNPKIPSLHVHDYEKAEVNQSKKIIFNRINDQKSKCVYNTEECFDSNEELQLLVRVASQSSMPNDLSDNENEFKDLRYNENAKLITPELEIPKGFDFLSNW
ncbi:uncharacterized protein LOC123037870 isoform X2 [Drosophila rhopaloa]|uniref:DUF4706 domain-containing protein n=1 Tax=Drosophila rhopaloa TaxID=1041015 RepID=A0ABM5JCE2_DRORH|nr:uncharacterized protein LOC123037870 isoform X2 [Drosophila rhopaloa]